MKRTPNRSWLIVDGPAFRSLYKRSDEYIAGQCSDATAAWVTAAGPAD
jgi:hypothetical protein